MSQDNESFILPGFVSPWNKIINLSIRRTDQYSLTSRNGSKKIGIDDRKMNIGVDDLNIAFLFYMCAYIEAVLESFLLDYLNHQNWERNVFYKFLFDEITSISGPHVYSKKFLQYYGRELKLGIAIKAVFDLRNSQIHASSRISSFEKMAWLGCESHIPKFYNWLIKRFKFSDNEEFSGSSVMNCNLVFNQLFIDVNQELMLIQPNTADSVITASCSVDEIKMSLDGWIDNYSNRCGGFSFRNIER